MWYLAVGERKKSWEKGGEKNRRSGRVGSVSARRGRNNSLELSVDEQRANRGEYGFIGFCRRRSVQASSPDFGTAVAVQTRLA